MEQDINWTCGADSMPMDFEQLYLVFYVSQLQRQDCTFIFLNNSIVKLDCIDKRGYIFSHHGTYNKFENTYFLGERDSAVTAIEKHELPFFYWTPASSPKYSAEIDFLNNEINELKSKISKLEHLSKKIQGQLKVNIIEDLNEKLVKLNEFTNLPKQDYDKILNRLSELKEISK
jgi:hypothetical protein